MLAKHRRHKEAICTLLLATTFLATTACTSWTPGQIDPAALSEPTPASYRIRGVVRTTADTLWFSADPKPLITQDAISGWRLDGDSVLVPLSEVEMMLVDWREGSNAALYGVLGAVAAIVLVLALLCQNDNDPDSPSVSPCSG